MGETNKNKYCVKGLWRFRPGEKKPKEINIVNNLNQISKKSAWGNITLEKTAFLDTSASLHLVHERSPTEINILQQQQKTVTILNGQSMKTPKKIKIKINSLPEEAKIGNILPGIKHNLISEPPLCDAGCEVLFRKKDVLVTKDNKLLLKGWCDPINLLWRVPLIQDEKDTPSKHYYDILSKDNDNNQQNSGKDEFFSHRLMAIKTRICKQNIFLQN